jgi:hypothetical protein
MIWVEDAVKCLDRLTRACQRYSVVLVAALLPSASHHSLMKHHRIM